MLDFCLDLLLSDFVEYCAICFHLVAGLVCRQAGHFSSQTPHYRMCFDIAVLKQMRPSLKVMISGPFKDCVLPIPCALTLSHTFVESSL